MQNVEASQPHGASRLSPEESSWQSQGGVKKIEVKRGAPLQLINQLVQPSCQSKCERDTLDRSDL